MQLRGRQTQFYIDVIYGVFFAAGFGYLLTVGMDPLVAAFQSGLVLGYFLRVWENMSVYERILQEEVAAEAEEAVAEELEDTVPGEVEEAVAGEVEEAVAEEVEGVVAEEAEEVVAEEAEEAVPEEVTAEVEKQVAEEMVDEIKARVGEEIDQRLEEEISKRVAKVLHGKKEVRPASPPEQTHTSSSTGRGGDGAPNDSS